MNIMWICTTLTILVSFSTAETGIEDLNVRVNTLENLMKHYVRVIEKQSEEISHLKKTVVSLTAINEELELFKSKTKSKTQTQHDQGGLAEKAETEDDADTMTDCLESKKDQIKMTEMRPASKTLTKTKSRLLRGLVPFNRESRLLNPATTLKPYPQITTTAFYAYLTHTESSPGPHHTLIFDKVVTNVNNAYNRHSGIFTCPTRGVYAFIYTPRVNYGHFGTFQIVKNSDVLGQVHVHSSGTNTLMSAGNAVVSLEVGDIVYVRTRPTGDFAMHGDVFSDGYGWPYFSGWLISQI